MIPSTVHLWHFVLFIRSASSSKQLIESSKLKCDLISNDNFTLTFCHQTFAKYNWSAREMDRRGYKKKLTFRERVEFFIKMSICWWIFYFSVDQMSNVFLQILESFRKAIHFHCEFYRFLLFSLCFHFFIFSIFSSFFGRQIFFPPNQSHYHIETLPIEWNVLVWCYKSDQEAHKNVDINKMLSWLYHWIHCMFGPWRGWTEKQIEPN